MTPYPAPPVHLRFTRTRREFIRDAFCGFGSLALASILHSERLRAATMNPLAPQPPHRVAKAKSIIFLFMAGGPSPPGTFHPKPLLHPLNRPSRPQEFRATKDSFVQK